MIKLPEREEDGGIDLSRIVMPRGETFAWLHGDVLISISADEFARRLIAHTIKRCARVADAQSGDYNESNIYECGVADGVTHCFNAIRKLEV